MDSSQHEALQRMFVARRLHPWIPEHDAFIRGEIAKLDVLEPKDAASFKEFYAKKMDEYVDAQKALENLPEQVITGTGEITMEDLKKIEKRNLEKATEKAKAKVKLLKKSSPK